MPYLSKFYNLAFVITSTLHIIIASRVFPHLDATALKTIIFSSQGAQLTSLITATIVWCIFTLWDLRRTNINQTFFFFLAVSVLLLGGVCFGPAAMLIRLLKWREIALERSQGSRTLELCISTSHVISRTEEPCTIEISIFFFFTVPDPMPSFIHTTPLSSGYINHQIKPYIAVPYTPEPSPSPFSHTHPISKQPSHPNTHKPPTPAPQTSSTTPE